MTTAFGTSARTQYSNSIQRLPQENHVDPSFARELYDACIRFFTAVVQAISKLGNDNIEKHQLGKLKEELGRLYLWGSDYGDGKLACVLAQSDELRDDVLELLSGISRLLVNSK